MPIYAKLNVWCWNCHWKLKSISLWCVFFYSIFYFNQKKQQRFGVGSDLILKCWCFPSSVAVWVVLYQRLSRNQAISQFMVFAKKQVGKCCDRSEDSFISFCFRQEDFFRSLLPSVDSGLKKRILFSQTVHTINSQLKNNNRDKMKRLFFYILVLKYFVYLLFAFRVCFNFCFQFYFIVYNCNLVSDSIFIPKAIFLIYILHLFFFFKYVHLIV